MESKYSMSLEDNIFFAKRKLVDNIYNSATLEGILTTISDVYAFTENINTENFSIDDILILKGLFDSWNYLFKTLEQDLNFDYLKKVQLELCKLQIIEPVAKIRNKNITILGTTWTPKIKSELEYKIEFEKMLTNINTLEGIIHLFCYIQRLQMFEFGNKRLANLIANKEMIKNGFGIITIPVNKVNTYLTLLIEYYETNKFEKITNWIYENCIDGVEK